MQVEFECGCGEMISEFTRGEEGEISALVECEECAAVYAVTISGIAPVQA